MQPVDAAFAVGETDRRSCRIREAHELHDEGAIARRGPRQPRIGRAPVVVVEGELRPAFIDQAEHAVEGGAEHVGLDARGQRLAFLQRDSKGIDIARLAKLATDRRRQRGDLLRFFEVVVRLGFERLRRGGDDEKTRRRCAFAVEEPDQVRPGRGVRRDLDIELASLGLRFENDARRIDPHLHWPRRKLPTRSHRDGRAAGAGGGEKVGERRLGGARDKATNRDEDTRSAARDHAFRRRVP